jgi:hypothetical protein
METHIIKAHKGIATPHHPEGDLIPYSIAAALNLGESEEEALGLPKSTPWTLLGNLN